MASDALFDLSFRFRKSKLWERLKDDEVFAVPLPEGETGYCAVMGSISGSPSLQLYVGAAGYCDLRRGYESLPEGPEAAMQELWLVNRLECLFFDASTCPDPALNDARAYAEAHGKKLRGKAAFPAFLHLTPLRAPALCTEAEEPLLCAALSGALVLGKLLNSYAKEELRIAPFGPKLKELPRVEEANGKPRLRFVAPPPLQPLDFPSPALPNDVTAERLRRMKRRGSLFAAFLVLPSIEEDEEAGPGGPFSYAASMALADPETGEGTFVTAFCDEGDWSVDLAGSIADALLERSACPNAIECADDRTEHFLQRICDSLRVTLRRMPDAEDAIAFRAEALSALMDEDEEEDDLGGFPFPNVPFVDVEEDEDEAIDTLIRRLNSGGGEQPKKVTRRARGRAPKGDCYLCGGSFSKSGYKKHLLSAHAARGEKTQDCVLVKAEDMDRNEYWLFLDLPATATLGALDKFLREIWLECCGHLSEFSAADYSPVPKSRKLDSFALGTSLRYVYDFGSSTELCLTIEGRTTRPKQRNAVRLLARNQPPRFDCSVCGKSATVFCSECDMEMENPFYCDDCADGHGEETEHDSFLPVTNSPRMGVCAYDGELDRYAFDPSKTKRS